MSSIETVAGNAGLDALFAPRSVALIGASPRADSLGGRPLLNLQRQGFAGAIYPVNPRYREIGGLRCYPDLLALPEPPDVVLVLVGADRVFDTLDQAVKVGARTAIVFGGGFAEIGAEGAARQARLSEYAARGLRICGPNCNGVFSLAHGAALGFSPAFEQPARRGPVALVSQSGNVATNIASRGMAAGLGFSHIVASGNEADLGLADYVEHLAAEPDVGVIALFIESIHQPQRLLRAARTALHRGRPVLALKVGRSEVGQRVALSHTGALTGSWAVMTAALRQQGVAIVSDPDALWTAAALFATGRRPSSRGLGVASLSGGMAGIVADACEDQGVALPGFAPATATALAAVLPSTAQPANPLDVTGQVVNEPESWPRCLAALDADPGIDAVLSVLSITAGQTERRFAEDMATIARDSARLHLCLWPSAEPPGSGIEILRTAGVPVVPRVADAVDGLAAWYRWWQARPERLAAPDGDVVPAANRAPADDWALLDEAGIPVARQRRFRSSSELSATLAGLHFPLALKADSAALAHKTERGALRLGLRTEADVRDACNALAADLSDVHDLGFLAQEMVAGRRELILGLKREPGLGIAVLVGLGGIFSEALKDVAIRVAPLSVHDAAEMLGELRGRAILGAFRGLGPVRPGMLEETLLGLSRIAQRHADRVEELDINPLIIADDGQSCAAVDLLVRWRDEEAR